MSCLHGLLCGPLEWNQGVKMCLGASVSHRGSVALNTSSSIVFASLSPPYNIFHTLYLRALYKAINYLQWSDGMKADMTAIIYSATSRTQFSRNVCIHGI